MTRSNKPTVLLVDDEPNVLEGLRRALRKEGYDFHTATGGRDALEIMKEHDIDVVVSDQDMPGMTGTVLLTRVRRAYPNTIRFILTGKATLEVAIQAINNGAVNRFFTKPCNYVDLAVSINQALDHKALMERARRLLATVRYQSAMLRSLESDHPGITHVRRDSTGAIVADQVEEEFDDILREMDEELDRSFQ